MRLKGHVAELVYAYVSEAYGAILGGSSPLMPTTYVHFFMDFSWSGEYK
jgi:hypothetical protein